MDKTIAVTGITGHTGRFFLQELIKNNYQGCVRCLVRETTDTSILDNSGLNISKIVGDKTRSDSLEKLIDGAEIVVHIANIQQSPDVVRICKKNGVERLILVHTTGIYSKYKMASAEYKEIEASVRELLVDSSLDVTILRPTMIFGDMCDHNIHKFIRMVDKLPLMPEINHGEGRLQPVNARDLGKAYYQAMMALHLPEYDYVVSGECSITMHELFELIGLYLGKKVHFINCPMGVGVFLAKVLKTVTFGRIDYVEKVLRMGENRDYGHDAAARDFLYSTEEFKTGLAREVVVYKRLNG